MTISTSELLELTSIMKGEKGENKETEKPKRGGCILYRYILDAKSHGGSESDDFTTVGIIASSFEEAISIFRKGKENNEFYFDLELISIKKDEQVKADSKIGIYSTF